MQVFLRKKNICFVFLLLSFFKPLAQENLCECNFKNLKDLYLTGQFTTLKTNLNCCLNTPKKISLNEMNRIKELLALTAIAEDSIELANIFLDEIVSSNPNYEPENQNIVFQKLFYNAKKENLRVTVSSVSKRPEDLETAPAVVEIIEAKDIVARGYVDLIDLLSDISGFEISKTYSMNYANVYQLGYRQEATERTLFMIDGVEENDLWSNIAYISRQYPISNIKAIEILYGPSATMYGPRAFMGTINVITYSPKEEAGNYFENEKLEEGSPFYFHTNIAGGSFSTYDLDFTLGNSGKDKQVYFQLTGRYFRSEEHDMSAMPFFDYDPADLNNFEYEHLNQSFDSQSELQRYLTFNKIGGSSPYYTITGNTIVLTDLGRDTASKYDEMAYLDQVNGNFLNYSNHTENFFIGGKVAINNLIIGFRAWNRAEGMNNMQDLDIAPSKSGSMWVPTNRTMYLKYNHAFNDNLSFSAQTSIKNHSLDKETNRVNFIPFGNPNSNLDIVDIINYNADSTNKDQTPHGWRNQFYYYQSLQGRTEARFFYNSKSINITFGTDHRMTSSQGDYMFYKDFNTNVSQGDYEENLNLAQAQEYGQPSNYLFKNNIYKLNEIGGFLQGNIILGEKLHLNAGIRYDRQMVRSTLGYKVFEPRLGLVLTSNRLTIKTNYSKGFQNVSLFNKFSTGGNRIPNPRLVPEEIQYLDASILGKSENEQLKWNLTAFIYDVENAISSRITPEGRIQNFNETNYLTLGGMFNLKYRTKRFRFDLNGTFFDPLEGSLNISEFISTEVNIETLPEDEKRVGDIASFKLNMGITAFYNNNAFESSLNLRANYVGDKLVGPGTSQDLNLGLNGSGVIPEYLVVNSNFIFGFKRLPAFKFAISSNNLLNSLFYHPGIQSAAGSFELGSRLNGENYEQWIDRTLTSKHVPYVPQRRRHFNFKIIMDL